MRKLAIALLAGASLMLAADSTTATLLDAAESGDHAAAIRLLGAKGANVNATGADGTTAIMYAAANDDLELVRALIKAGANVKLKNQFGTSALTEAAIIGSAPIIEALLKAGADPNFRTTDGETPLMAAARSGKIDAAKALLAAGADINAKENWGGQSAIMWAAAQGQADMVKFLASKDASLNEHGKVNQWERKIIQEPRPKDMNKGGFSALHYAAREGCSVCVQNLLTAGADRFRRSGPRDAAAARAGEYAFRHRCGARQRRRRSRQVGPVRPLAGLHGGRRQHAADERERRGGRHTKSGQADGPRCRAHDARKRRESEYSAEAASAVSRRPAGSRRRRHARPGRYAAIACCARRR